MMLEKSKLLNDKYQIISEIKKGGFGIVYYGFDKNLGKAIAIKEIAPELLAEAKYIDMFQAEARSAAKLNHHNIVHIFDLLKTPEGRFYIIMEYIDGVDLSKMIKKSRHNNNPLSINLATYIIGEACKALEYAHNRKDAITGEPLNLIHQDISPSNIMVSMNGDVKIIDFGIARVRLEKKNYSKNQIVTGKLPYLSPEQFDGGILIDGRSDIFSLSTVFYELITGERLFNGPTDQETALLIKNGKINLHRLQEMQVPEALQHIISRALQPDVTQRYQSANQMYLDLAQYLMVASQTIELSDELGDYVKQLFDVDHREDAENGPVTLEGEAPAPNQAADENIALAEPEIFARNLANELDLKENKEQDDLLSELNIEENDLLAFQVDSRLSSLDNLPDTGNDVPHEKAVEWDIKDLSPTILANENNTEIPLELEFDIKPRERKEEKPEPQESPEKSGPEHKDTPRPAAPGKIKNKPAVAPKPKAFAPPVVPRVAVAVSAEEGDDEVKTVIDVVRLASRSYKRQIIGVLAGMAVIAVLFFTIDTLTQWTSLGKGVYNFLFPPAIKIVSYPAGAQVYLDDDLLEGKTPVSIQDISPGIHKLRLVLNEFSPILKSIKVPQKGELKVEGTQKSSGSDAYIFRFMTTVELRSSPLNASVYVNDIKLKQVTPCEIRWEVGKPLTIEMEKAGFQRLTGFTFNILNTNEAPEDRMFWQVSKQTDPNNKKLTRFLVQGAFRKIVQVQSSPSRAGIYVDNADKPAGITGSNGIIYLTFGPHEILVKKSGFIPQKIDIMINESSSSKFNVILQRRIRFRARDITSPQDGDIEARLVHLISRGRKRKVNRTTPFELQLSAKKYEALFQKSGYEDLLVPVNPEQRVVVVQMQPNHVPIEIFITDALSGAPLADVEISYRPLNDKKAKEKSIKPTNADGISMIGLSPGQYLVKVKKDGYFQRRVNYTTNTKGKNRIRFNLVAQ